MGRNWKDEDGEEDEDDIADTFGTKLGREASQEIREATGRERKNLAEPQTQREVAIVEEPLPIDARL